MRARDNPFRVERLHALAYRFLDGDLESLLARLAAHGYRGAIVGPHGSGKTTLLGELMSRLRSQGQSIRELRLTEATRQNQTTLLKTWLASVRPGEILVLDGAEQLDENTWRDLLSATSETSGFLITTHTPGRLPTVYECRTTPDLLQHIVTTLTGPAEISEHDLPGLFESHGGNVRDCLRELYDRTGK
ncbi:DEAD/DEAH box helicase family protein [Planctomicrobium piriforme]|uniref:AAA+ ATPase domain-containing protein n=1 Tax=Planctomicrobium piriforme TaxID=1576369 RepID=A0A1I3HJ68_9PLAN|nr:hypothetical protein [Planctomicrobium piriforme]SFI35774.1 hypothetical protein SAMN05421753_10887 [Planctomicrobium piriforme]